MPPFSPRFLALPSVALAVIIALAQAHSPVGARGNEVAPAVHQVTDCMAPSNTAACMVAGNGGATILR